VIAPETVIWNLHAITLDAIRRRAATQTSEEGLRRGDELTPLGLSFDGTPMLTVAWPC
jgi:hypothetical protein